KHMNKFGLNEFGKKQWNIMSENKKKESVKEIISKGINNAMDMCGFSKFSKSLNKFLDKESQYKYINNHIYYDLSQIVDYNKVDISNEIKNYYLLFRSFNELNNRFSSKDNKNIDVFKDTLIKFIENYEKTIIDIAINEKNIDNMTKIKELMELGSQLHSYVKIF